MVKIEKYTGEKTYILGNGELGTRERILELWPAALTIAHVAETDEMGECLMAFDPLSRLRSILGVDRALTEDQAIAAIEAMRNAEPEPPAPDALERLAAAIEFQNVLALSSAAAIGGDDA